MLMTLYNNSSLFISRAYAFKILKSKGISVINNTLVDFLHVLKWQKEKHDYRTR